jgi:hypothetical protein
MNDFNNLYNHLSDEYTLSENSSFHGMERDKSKILHLLRGTAEVYPQLKIRNMDGNAISINDVVVRVI